MKFITNDVSTVSQEGNAKVQGRPKKGSKREANGCKGKTMKDKYKQTATRYNRNVLGYR